MLNIFHHNCLKNNWEDSEQNQDKYSFNTELVLVQKLCLIVFIHIFTHHQLPKIYQLLKIYLSDSQSQSSMSNPDRGLKASNALSFTWTIPSPIYSIQSDDIYSSWNLISPTMHILYCILLEEGVWSALIPNGAPQVIQRRMKDCT